MAKKKTGEAKVPTTTPSEPTTRHARIELDDPEYQRLKAVAKANGLSVAAYIRQAVLKQIRRDEAETAE